MPARYPEPEATTAPRPATAQWDRVEKMAAYMTMKLGREEAEQTARSNAASYEAGSSEFAYWQGVAEKIKSGR